MRIVAAYTTDHHPDGATAPERYLVLEDGRGVYIDPLQEDRVDDDACQGLRTLVGRPQRNRELELAWCSGYPVLSLADRDRLVEIGDVLEAIDALGWVWIVPGPDYDACVPEGYVRLCDSVAHRFITLPWAVAVEALQRMPAGDGGALLFGNLRTFQRETDGAALWFAHEHDARRVYNGRTVEFHPLHGLVQPGEHAGDGWTIETFTVRQANA